MKIIVSTLYLADTLKKALADKGFNKIEFGDRVWYLNRLEKEALELSVDYTRDSSRALVYLEIDRAQWFKLLQFVKTLPEQPCVLEIQNWGFDDVRLRLSQFAADFY